LDQLSLALLPRPPALSAVTCQPLPLVGTARCAVPVAGRQATELNIHLIILAPEMPTIYDATHRKPWSSLLVWRGRLVFPMETQLA
jgi:hypothetical protein